jgi:DNA-binding transcriptional MocR family regulator
MEVEGAQALGYGSWDGYEGMREWVSQRYHLLEGLAVSPNDILITNGSGDALGQIFQTFIDEGDPVLHEVPCFVGGLQILRRIGADLHPIGIDHHGLRTDQLAEKLEAIVRAGRRPKLIYTVPNFQNPTGVTQPLSRRLEILALARRYDVPILEDDAYGEMRIDGEPVKSLYELDGGERVLRTGTLSKTLGAGTRIGWLVAPPSLAGYVAGFNFGGSVSPMMSRVATYYLREHFQQHLAHLREVYRAKRDAMLNALEEGLAGSGASWTRPEGGFFVWVTLPQGTNPGKLAELAQAQGIGYMSGPSFMLDGSGQELIRLAFSIPSAEANAEGTRLLCQAILAARE